MTPSELRKSLTLAISPGVRPALSRVGDRKWTLLITLAGIQFAHVLDFVLIMPLGPQLMRELAISPREFAVVVSIYNISAALTGLASAFFIDRFDRRTALLAICSGFGLGTLACGLVPKVGGGGFELLLFARTLTGAFGGLMQTLIFTIIGDCFRETKRGTATGTVMSAFSLASIFGIPLGLYLASRFGWRTPFLGLAVLVALSLAVASKTVPSLREHLTDQVKRTDSLRALLFERNSLVACALVIFLMFAGFSVVPFIGAYLVANVGLQERDLASVFLVGGIATFFTTRLIGVAADRYGKLSVFTWLATLSMLPVLALTNLPHVSVISAIVVTTLVTVLISARAIPALAMITSSVDKCRRGRFLSLTSSVQQASSGLASLIAGSILGKTPGGALTHYDHAGAIAVIATGLAILTARNLRLPPNNDDDRACEDA